MAFRTEILADEAAMAATDVADHLKGGEEAMRHDQGIAA
jgi:hypothetical protein